MSGIAGKWVTHRTLSADELNSTAKRLARSLLHRGRHSHEWAAGCCSPVLASVSSDEETKGLAASPDGRYVVVATDCSIPRVTDDCATVAQLIATRLPALGLQASLQLVSQPVSVAIWDSREKALTLMRDRMGQADIYYSCSEFGLTFATDLKTLADELPHPQDVDPDALSQLFRLGYIPAPFTVYRGVFKLPAGSTRTLNWADVRQWQSCYASPGPFTLHWDLREEAERSIACKRTGLLTSSIDAVIDALDEAIFRDANPSSAVLLSGGVDSSLIAALCQRQSATPIDTLSVGFDDPRHDESKWAAEVAAHLGARSTCLVMADRDALRLVETAAKVFSEPFADSSAIPALLAAEAASGIKAVLTGDGGDELFFGHGAYVKSLRNHNLVRHVPRWLRRASRTYMSRSPERARLGGIAALLSEAQCNSLAEIYLTRASRWRDPAKALRFTANSASPLLNAARHLQSGHPGELLLYLDQTSELPDGLLTKSDRVFSAYGVQARNPFLDDQVVGLAWRVPFEHKFSGGETKVVLKRALDRFLPDQFSRRPKKGFGAPVARWLNGPLRDWAEDLLDPYAVRNRGILNEEVVTGMWRSFLDGNRKFHTHLWPILMFQAWDRERSGMHSCVRFGRAKGPEVK